jgi:lipopolysaccharide/colanic/teichoic acid biosynthesis glycosyltransferase
VVELAGERGVEDEARPGAYSVRTADAKHAADVVLALGAVLTLAPVLVLLGLLVRLTSPGPVLFRQVRVGADGRTFTLLKFRSMRLGAEHERDGLSHLNEATGPLFKIRRDPRLKPIGRWMRRFSLDELPQLFNVLGGSMSLVGPRPMLPEETSAFTAAELRRHRVRPGMTGLAQVSGRSELSWADALELDLSYVDHRSWWLDLRILARTVDAVVRGRGAY